MIIPDTSTWVDHFRGKDTPLDDVPAAGRQWLLHPFVLGELLLGGLPKRRGVDDFLARLLPAPVASASEANAFIQWAKLAGTGVGYVDAHILVSARIASAQIVSADTRLVEQAARFDLAYAP